MRNIIKILLPAAFIIALNSCGNKGSDRSAVFLNDGEKILQQEDGSFSLSLEQAAFYKSEIDSSCNTAEWNIVVSVPGRYNVWLTSATRDTMNLSYINSVKINLEDERLEAKPVGDKIILNASDVKLPYYRAESFMGTFYIQEAGEYNLQVISEKVGCTDPKHETSSMQDNTKLMSVVLTPMTR